jgi:hypothetical protein
MGFVLFVGTNILPPSICPISCNHLHAVCLSLILLPFLHSSACYSYVAFLLYCKVDLNTSSFLPRTVPYFSCVLATPYDPLACYQTLFIIPTCLPMIAYTASTPFRPVRAIVHFDFLSFPLRGSVMLKNVFAFGRHVRNSSTPFFV